MSLQKKSFKEFTPVSLQKIFKVFTKYDMVVIMVMWPRPIYTLSFNSFPKGCIRCLIATGPVVSEDKLLLTEAEK